MSKPTRRLRLASRLMVASSTAILAIYTVGYLQTQPAADQLAARETGLEIGLAARPTERPTGLVTPTSLAPASSGPTPTSSPAPTVPPAASSPTTPAPTTPAGTTTAGLRDGSYSGSGTSRHGGIEVRLVVSSGRIVSAEISRCQTRYPCSRVAALPGQVVARQSGAVDMVTGATDSSRAYREAVNNALAQAR